MLALSKNLPPPGQHVALSDLAAVAARILQRAGVRCRDAEQMADLLVYAQASGIDSHGLAHLPHYIGGIANGTLRPRPNYRFFSSRSGVAVLDADDGPGVLAALAATDRAIALARSAGIGAVAVRKSGHFGVASAYADRIVSSGMIGLVLSNASPTVAPRGGSKAALGTNPVAAGFPRMDGAAVLIDFATTVGSRARVRKAEAQGEEIPVDWALDEEGRPTRDPAAALRGTMQALGGAKGTSLGLLVELLCVGLSGGLPGRDVRPPQDHHAGCAGVSHLVLAFDPEAFGGAEVVAGKVEDIARGIEAIPPADPVAPVRMPGARAAAARDAARRDGILITPQVFEALRRAELKLAGIERQGALETTQE